MVGSRTATGAKVEFGLETKARRKSSGKGRGSGSRWLRHFEAVAFRV